jgi:hypothetical protein
VLQLVILEYTESHRRRLILGYEESGDAVENLYSGVVGVNHRESRM